MGVNDRPFEPPAADVRRVALRKARLSPRLRALIRRADHALNVHDLPNAQRLLSSALAIAPGQPEVLCQYAMLLAAMGSRAAAVANFEAALRGAPDDAMAYWQYAHALTGAGDVAGALRVRRLAVARLPDSPLAWADLGEHLFACESVEASIPPLERAVQLGPDYAPGLFKLGSAYVACGRTEEGASMTRRALAVEPAFGAAWLGLADIKTVQITDTEMEQMRELLSAPSIDASERMAIQYALGAACERAGRYSEAFHMFAEANAARLRELPARSPEQFRAEEQQARDAYDTTNCVAHDPALGSQIIFIVGMPRSGTTLVEQILASHPQVAGGGELPVLPQVLTEESTRRRRRYPEWVPEATADDWQRLGQRYLKLTADCRRGKSRLTDKLPYNWRYLGAIRAMLPGACIVVCRRDPLETCWSCFKQYFPNSSAYVNDLELLGTFWQGFNHAALHWAQVAPASLRTQNYEALTENPEVQIRALLDFCGLPFDPACLKFHESRRSVDTLSATQVRQPIHRDQPIAVSYGALLDPLRRSLGLSPTDSGTPGPLTARSGNG